MLYRLVARLSGCSDTARDIVQEVFLRAMQQLSAGQSWDNPRAWLCRVAVNLWRDRLRSRHWWRFMPVYTDLRAPEEGNAETILDRRERTQQIGLALNQLPERDRVIVLLYQEGLSYAEMARVLDIKAASVGKRLGRAIDKLADSLTHKEKP